MDTRQPLHHELARPYSAPAVAHAGVQPGDAAPGAAGARLHPPVARDEPPAIRAVQLTPAERSPHLRRGAHACRPATAAAGVPAVVTGGANTARSYQMGARPASTSAHRAVESESPQRSSPALRTAGPPVGAPKHDGSHLPARRCADRRPGRPLGPAGPLTRRLAPVAADVSAVCAGSRNGPRSSSTRVTTDSSTARSSAATRAVTAAAASRGCKTTFVSTRYATRYRLPRSGSSSACVRSTAGGDGGARSRRSLRGAPSPRVDRVGVPGSGVRPAENAVCRAAMLPREVAGCVTSDVRCRDGVDTSPGTCGYRGTAR